jgi:hypothetical protein
LKQHEEFGMNDRPKQFRNSDAIAGGALIAVGTLALIAKLGLLTITIVSAVVLRWWPLLLIVLGVGLWAFEQESEEESCRRGEAKYVR